ncbi:MAG: magnesium/cobalt transporter CorA [Chloroflexota bacterium]|nr:magnesium/cobalt transporter CorA [Chloroflexota bacterium]
MIKALQCKSDTHLFSTIEDLNQISELRTDLNNLFWLDLYQPTEDELQQVAKEFNFHPLAVEDASHSHQRPKVEEYDNFFFVVFYAASLSEKRRNLEISELKMFMGENYLVTVHSQPVKELEEAERRWRRNAERMERGIGVMLYSLLDAIVDNYFPIVDNLVERSEVMEDQIFLGRAGEANFTSKLLKLKKLFLQLRRLAGPERDVLNVLTNRDSPIFNETNLVYFRDIYDHLLRVSDTLDLYRDQVTSAMDANLAVVSNDLNKVMRTMTAASIILMTDALLAGIWGMNFENIPELKWEYGYFIALALMFGIDLVLYYLFKRRKWL